MKRLALISFVLGGMILTGCERRAKDEPQREPGAFFPSYPCITCADGTMYCSDVHKDHC